MINLSLKKRVGFSFFVVNAMVIITGFLSFFYLNSLSEDIGKISKDTKTINSHTSNVSKSVNRILINGRKILHLEKKLSHQERKKLIEGMGKVVDNLVEQLKELGSQYQNTKIDKEVIDKMLGYVDSLKVVLANGAGVESVPGLVDKILDSFIELQANQNDYIEVRDVKLREIVESTKKTMMATLACTFFFAILLALIIPGKIDLPFRKIEDALVELQNANFDVSISYDQDDEVGKISREMNKMIEKIKKFEELREDHLVVEEKKFNTLASLIKKHVLIVDAEGKILYLNSQLYSLLDISSDDVLHKNVSDNLIPKDISDIYHLAVKRRTKIENAKVVIKGKGDAGDESDERTEATSEKVSGEKMKTLLEGYATVIPIRGKESSRDYYLMVISREIFSS